MIFKSLFFKVAAFLCGLAMVGCQVFAQPVSYLIIDGKTYDSNQVQIAARDPSFMQGAKALPNGDISIRAQSTAIITYQDTLMAFLLYLWLTPGPH